MGWLEFILERYNYWIVIVLMMTGLYIVFARGNLVKKIVGLNVFQTSVFIFYITIGKIAGGTAPIYKGGELDHDAEGGGHGGDAGHETGGGHETEAPLHEAPADASTGDNPLPGDESLHARIENDFATNDMKAALEKLNTDNAAAAADPESLHAAPGAADRISNDDFLNLDKPDGAGFDIAGQGLHDSAANSLADALHHTGEVIYTNPLPHVLILTAIVVGVATTAVGLALAVRIREAYGTIEEDELETIDNVAEFGHAAQLRAQKAAS